MKLEFQLFSGHKETLKLHEHIILVFSSARQRMVQLTHSLTFPTTAKSGDV